ncbi:EAL domain-containing protein [Pantoea vagans]|uniref:EAL domain-containing protein n=1 Tax=Pantoea vagans TaxID=470934 RepID=UPI003FA3841F
MCSRLPHVIATFGLCVVIMLAGIGFTWFQVSQSELDDTALAAEQAIQASDRLIDQARRAATHARPYLSHACSPQTQAELARLAIGSEHIRVISLFKHAHMTCSSWSGALAVKEDLPASSARIVTLLNDDYITPGVPVMVLRTSFPEGIVTTSMATQPAAEALRLLSIHRPLSLRSGIMILTADNRLHPVPIRNKTLKAVRSDRYPLWVEYDGGRLVPLVRIMREGYVSLIMSLLLGVVAATRLWLFAFRRMTPYEELAIAINRGELVPWYQPVIDAQTGLITGAEVLARHVKPDGTMIMPDRFIPLAEGSDLIIPLTRSLMAQAARELSVLLKPTDPCWHIGINITQAHVLEPEFIAECQNFIQAFAPGRIKLTVELTEREPFNNSPFMQAKLKELHENGISVALDDFGTGYANLEYISEVSVDIIKIDRAFVRRIGEGKSGERLLTSLIEMASALNLLMVAEGIETREQAAWLTSHGIMWQQGYLYSPPVPYHALLTLVRNWKTNVS